MTDLRELRIDLKDYKRVYTMADIRGLVID